VTNRSARRRAAQRPAGLRTRGEGSSERVGLPLALRAWGATLDQLHMALQTALPIQPEVIPAALERGEANNELAAAVAAHDQVVALRDEALARRQAAETEAGSAEPHPPGLEAILAGLVRRHKFLLLAVESALTHLPAELAVGASFALHADAGGRMAGDLLGRVLGIQTGRAARLVGSRHKDEDAEREARSGLYEATFEELIVRAASAYDARCGKPREYHAAVVVNRARDNFRDREIADKDSLEVDPKGKRRGHREEASQALDRERHRVDPAFEPTTVDLESLFAVGQDIERYMSDPTERRLLAGIAAADENPTEACRAEGVSRRVWENLRDRLRRRRAAG